MVCAIAAAVDVDDVAVVECAGLVLESLRDLEEPFKEFNRIKFAAADEDDDADG